ncbi:MAG: glutamate--tRNA ligase [Thermodesulfobacteriota bacterium]|nr:glutamate--tRNA ligase [Thermodesulfobacteriota bacterium]
MAAKVRVRFAPSPTGHLHIGNARTALFNWLFARSNNGKFILRIEDTDVERSTIMAEEEILDNLKWLGLNWDEGPDIKGEYGPYRQSERLKIYIKYADWLLSSGKAYRCYCSPEKLEKIRDDAISKGKTPKYPGTCRELTRDECKKKEEQGIKPSIRFKVGEENITVFDILHGEIHFSNDTIDDLIIIRSDGRASYNFAVVVDDALMEITHVIRGEDHISNTPKQILIGNALGFNIPFFLHHALTHGSDNTRLSKRHGVTSISSYRNSGFLPQALVNYLVLLGWSHPQGKELISLNEMVRVFKPENISKSSAIFDLRKLTWLNGNYIRKLGDKELGDCLLPYIEKSIYAAKIKDKHRLRLLAWVVKDKLNTIEQIKDFFPLLFEDEIEITPKAMQFLKEEKAVGIVYKFMEELKKFQVLDDEVYKKIITAIREKINVKGKTLFMTLRIALTGTTQGPELERLVKFWGRETCIKRIENFYRLFNGYKDL